jgi:hypothetical protein
MTKKATLQFLEFLTSLAPEGETALIVRQKPQLKDGEMQFHADGAIKCTWPAALPDITKIKDGQSWYGNTASFIIDRFQEGKVSASAANCEYCIVLVLDDIGTKSKAPPLEPTWKMETSPGSFQWGYAFSDDQPTKGEFAAAIKAIADAGYTDPGALNPVRNFRLPGSINLKPGRNSFAAQLVEFHPEREFSLTEICDALGVVPAEADGAGPRPIRVHDTGGDDVFAWLAEQGMVLRKPNAEGWAGVICPNSAEHTDGNPEGRYLPATRAYCCLHSHCLDFDTKTFLQWVADNGGPKHEPGFRDDLIASTMQDALQKLEPSSFFTDDAAAVIAEVERKEVGRLEKSQWYERFAYVQDDDAYFDLQDRREISRGTFNAIFRHIGCRSIHNGRKVEASVCFDENRQAQGARVLVGITYAAGESVLVARDGDVYANRWRDARPPVDKALKGDIGPWLEHCERLVPEASEREHLFNIMAYKVQHPEIKINHAVLHGGDQGCGKDTLWAPFIWAVCGPGMKNRGLLDNDTLGSQWGYQLEAEIIILNELKEPEAKERRALANKLKPIIAAPPEMLSINRKNMHPYDMVNRGFVLAFSNDPVPISIDSQDRRWFCVWSSAPRMNPDEAFALWNWYKSGGFEAIAAWLYQRDVSAFNPAAAPAWTEFKANLVEHGMSMAESYLVDMMRERKGEFAKGVIGSPFHALCDRLAGTAPSGVKVPQAALLHALKEAKWVDMGRISSGDLPSKKHIFCAPDMVGKVSKSELRRLVEEAPMARMALVK